MSTLKVNNLQTVDGSFTVAVADLATGGGGGSGGGVTAHGALSGLSNDDHPQYHNNARGDARYSQLGHGHSASQISDSTATGRAVLTATDAAAARAAIGAGTGNGDVMLTGAQTISGKTAYTFASEANAGNSGTAVTVNFATGQKQRVTLTGNATITLSFPGVGNYQLVLVQDATGSRTVSFVGSPLFLGSPTQPAINTAANGRTMVSIYWDGTDRIIGIAKIGAT